MNKRERFKKEIELDDDRILEYDKDPDGYSLSMNIRECFLKGNDVQKNYCLRRWDDYAFNAWCGDIRNLTKLSFEFNIDHPLYIHLFHLLNYDDEVIIDDDDSMGFNKKYMRIYRKDKTIYIDFINDLTDEEKDNLYPTEWFRVFIKNTGPDVRSKIDSCDKDTKIRLYYFFMDVFNEAIEDYHQISIEEWLLGNSETEVSDDMKRFFKRKVQWPFSSRIRRD